MGILAKIEEMRLRRLNKKLEKMGADNLSYLLSSGYFHDENYTGGKSRLLTDYFLEHEEEFRKEAEERVRNSPEYKVELFRGKYKYTQLRNCPLCDNNISLNIYSEVYDGSTGLGGGYHIYAKIKCGKCSCSLDPVDLYTNIYDLRNEPDELVSNYAQKWNTRYDDLEKLHKACRHNSSAPVKLFYKGFMKDIQFKEDKPNE